MQRLCLLLLLACCSLTGWSQGVLIIADEFPAMQNLAAHLEADRKVKSQILGQTELPQSLAGYRAVMVYLHGPLNSGTEARLIQYANEGGNLIVLHHTISSKKRENKDWFNFLHIELPLKAYEEGGYKYFDPATYEVVNLAPESPLTKGAKFDRTVSFTDPRDGVTKQLPGTRFANTEVYLNHNLNGPRTLLLGMKYTDPTANKVYQQDTAAWLLQTGKGEVFYFMMGHRSEDFDNPVYRQMLGNAVEYSK